MPSTSRPSVGGPNFYNKEQANDILGATKKTKGRGRSCSRRKSRSSTPGRLKGGPSSRRRSYSADTSTKTLIEKVEGNYKKLYESLSKKYHERESKVDALQEQKQELEAALKNKEEEASALQKMLSEKEQICKMLENQIEVAMEANQDMEKVLESTENELSKASEEVKSLESEKKDAVDKALREEYFKEEAEKKLVATKSKLSKESEQVETLLERVTSLESNEVHLKKTCEDAVAKAERLEAMVSSLKADLEATRKENEGNKSALAVASHLLGMRSDAPADGDLPDLPDDGGKDYFTNNEQTASVPAVLPVALTEHEPHQIGEEITSTPEDSQMHALVKPAQENEPAKLPKYGALLPEYSLLDFVDY